MSKIWHFQDWTCIPLWSILHFSKWGWAILNIGAWCFFEFLLIYTFLLFAFCRCEYELRWFHAGSWGLKNTVRNICNVGQKLKYEKNNRKKIRSWDEKKKCFSGFGKIRSRRHTCPILIFSDEVKTRNPNLQPWNKNPNLESKSNHARQLSLHARHSSIHDVGLNPKQYKNG